MSHTKEQKPEREVKKTFVYHVRVYTVDGAHTKHVSRYKGNVRRPHTLLRVTMGCLESEMSSNTCTIVGSSFFETSQGPTIGTTH